MIEDIVNVQITRETKSVSRAGFSVLMILGISKAFTALLKFYTSLSAVMEDFNSNSSEYKAAQAAFSQSPSPTRIAIGRRGTSDVTTITVNTAVASTKYSCTINGTKFEITSGGSPTPALIAAALVAAINAGSEPVTAADLTGGVYSLTADVAGVAYSANVDTRQSMAFATAQTVAEDLADIQQSEDGWYGLVLTDRTQANVEAAAAYIEAVKKVFLTASDDADIIDETLASDTTSIAAVLKAAGYARSGCLYSANADTSYPDAAALAAVLTLDPGSWTLKFKTMAGITVDKLSSTQRTNALAKKCNIYEEVGGVNIVENGTVAEGEWLDIIVFVDWLDSRITEEVYALLVNQLKVPYTDSGIAAIEAEIKGVLQQGVAVGGIANDPAFTITVPKAADVSSTDKANRELNNVKFTATLAGAIHAVNISGTVTV